jgi:hypothetical protein
VIVGFDGNSDAQPPPLPVENDADACDDDEDGVSVRSPGEDDDAESDDYADGADTSSKSPGAGAGAGTEAGAGAESVVNKQDSADPFMESYADEFDDDEFDDDDDDGGGDGAVVEPQREPSETPTQTGEEEAPSTAAMSEVMSEVNHLQPPDAASEIGLLKEDGEKTRRREARSRTTSTSEEKATSATGKEGSSKADDEKKEEKKSSSGDLRQPSVIRPSPDEFEGEEGNADGAQVCSPYLTYRSGTSFFTCVCHTLIVLVLLSMFLKENPATSTLTGDNENATTQPETTPKASEGELDTGSYADEYDDEEDNDDGKVRLPYITIQSLLFFPTCDMSCISNLYARSSRTTQLLQS